MAQPTAARDAPMHPEATDQRVIVHGVSWAQYCLARELFDSPGIRLSSLEGALEVMSPRHEILKKTIARLVELFALERDVPLIGYGSTTFRQELRERGLEPDESYCLGGPLRDFPDIAIEVALPSGGLDKLSIDGAYRPIERSALVPALDFGRLAAFMHLPDQHAAVKAFRDHLRAEGPR